MVRLLALVLLLSSVKSERVASFLETNTTISPKTVDVKVVPDSFCDDAANRCVGKKPRTRRTTPVLLRSEFESALTKSKDVYIIKGDINGWFAYKDLNVKEVQCWVKKGGLPKSHDTMIWDATKKHDPLASIANAGLPCQKGNEVLRLKLVLPEFLHVGWAPANPGFVYLGHNLHDKKYLVAGREILKFEDADLHCEAVSAHAFKHKYGGSDSRDVHTGILVEWDDGCDYTTVFELAWRDGVGGYSGKTNWFADKLAKPTNWLFSEIVKSQPGMVQPWNSKLAEIRVWDIPQKNKDEFAEYLRFYSDTGDHNEPAERFKKPYFPFSINNALLSAKVSMSFRSRGDIFKSLLNYMGHSDEYNILSRHCQTFAADFFTHLTGQKTTTAMAIVRVFHKLNTDWFLYDPDLV